MTEFLRKNILKIGIFIVNILLVLGGVLAIRNSEQKKQYALQSAQLQDVAAFSAQALQQAQSQTESYGQSSGFGAANVNAVQQPAAAKPVPAASTKTS